jgi:hypothetical protein
MCEWAPKGSAFPLRQHFARAIKHKEGKQHSTVVSKSLCIVFVLTVPSTMTRTPGLLGGLFWTPINLLFFRSGPF